MGMPLPCPITTFMQDKFRNTYRIPSARWQDWDYAAGAYFITINTAHRVQWFGQIKNGNMKLSAFGEIAARFWHDIPNHFPSVRLDAFVVMPDHIHGILVIDSPEIVVETLHATSENNLTNKPDNNPLHATSDNNVTEKPDNYPLHATSDNNANNISDIPNELYVISGSETLHATSLRDNTTNLLHSKNEQMSMISPKSGSLSQIIRSYKSAVSKQIHLINPAFAWQTRFYDRVIRDWEEYRRIACYIETNPKKWEEKNKSYLAENQIL